MRKSLLLACANPLLAIGALALFAGGVTSALNSHTSIPLQAEASIEALEPIPQVDKTALEESPTTSMVVSPEADTPLIEEDESSPPAPEQHDSPAPSRQDLTPSDRPVVHAPGDLYDPADENVISTAWEYRATYAGTCPSGQPDNMGFKQHQWPSAALGLNSPYPTLEWGVEYMWQVYMTNDPNLNDFIASMDQLQLVEEGIDKSIAFYMDWDNERVYWDALWAENRPFQTDSPRQTRWDEIATYMTTYLRSLNRRYNELCPHEWLYNRPMAYR